MISEDILDDLQKLQRYCTIIDQEHELTEDGFGDYVRYKDIEDIIAKYSKPTIPSNFQEGDIVDIITFVTDDLPSINYDVTLFKRKYNGWICKKDSMSWWITREEDIMSKTRESKNV